MGSNSSIENMPISTTIVGIDLGTTFSSIAVYKNGKPEVIPNNYGDHLTPSVVFYDPNNDDISVGKYAEEWAIKEMTNFIYDTKRLMGRKYDDVYVQDIINKREYTYKIVRGLEDNVAIEVKQNNIITQKSPEEVGSEILKYLKKSATLYLGETVTQAVVSVPSHFSNAQRKATKRAAEQAGFTVLKLISEPVAAAIHYNMDKIGTKSTMLLFDLGGGTLDVSVVDVDKEEFKVRGLQGDSFLGGKDFDNNLMTHFFSTLLQNIREEGLNKYNLRHLLRVKQASTKIKIMLSDKEEAISTLDHFGKDRNDSLPLIVSRAQFESLNETLFNRAIDLVTHCLADLELSNSDIDSVILAGGSSRIPKIQSLLASYFGKSKLKTDVNPDEAIALGAAIQAAIFSVNQNAELEKYKITEVAPLSIGINVYGGRLEVGIPKNTPLPATTTIFTTTSRNDQKVSEKNIYEGERLNCKFNTLLGSLTLDNLPPGKAGTVDIQTTFNLDQDGILTVETWTISNGQKNTAVVTLQEYRLSQSQIKSTFADAKRFKQEDELFVKFMKYKCKSELYCYHILYDLNKITDFEKRCQVKRLCNNYILECQKMDVSINTLNELKDSFETFKEEVKPLIQGVITVLDETLSI